MKAEKTRELIRTTVEKEYGAYRHLYGTLRIEQDANICLDELTILEEQAHIGRIMLEAFKCGYGVSPWLIYCDIADSIEELLEWAEQEEVK